MSSSYPKGFVHGYTMVQKGDEAARKIRKLSRAAGGTESCDFYEMIVDSTLIIN